MVLACEIKGKYGRKIFEAPEQQFAGIRAIGCSELIAFCLMGTHLHLVVEADTFTLARECIEWMSSALDATAEERGVAHLALPHTQVLGDDHAVLRYVAYAHNNPVKARMVEVPLAWPFSSHRDVFGLRCAQWFSPAGILSRMDEKLDLRWFHRKAEGRPRVPSLDEPFLEKHPVEDMAIMARAVASVFGIAQDELGDATDRAFEARSCLVSVARWHGWRAPSIGRFLKKSPRQIRRLARVDTAQVRAVMATLRDVRLRPTGSSWWEVPAEARGPNLWTEWRESHDR
jgi:hypothetical protein